MHEPPSISASSSLAGWREAHPHHHSHQPPALNGATSWKHSQCHLGNTSIVQAGGVFQWTPESLSTHTLCFHLCEDSDRHNTAHQPTWTFIRTGVYSDCFFFTCGLIFSLISVVCSSENQIVCKCNHLQFKLTSIPPWSRISVWKRCKSQF